MKVAPEKEFRKSILNKAKILGCDIEVKNIFNRYDNLLKTCTNESERQHIKIMGIAELHKLMGCYGGLTVNGVEIIPPDPTYKSNQ